MQLQRRIELKSGLLSLKNWGRIRKLTEETNRIIKFHLPVRFYGYGYDILSGFYPIRNAHTLYRHNNKLCLRKQLNQKEIVRHWYSIHAFSKPGHYHFFFMFVSINIYQNMKNRFSSIFGIAVGQLRVLPVLRGLMIMIKISHWNNAMAHLSSNARP